MESKTTNLYPGPFVTVLIVDWVRMESTWKIWALFFMNGIPMENTWNLLLLCSASGLASCLAPPLPQLVGVVEVLE